MRNQKERDTKTQGYILFVMDTPAVSRAYVSRKLTRPLPTKDGGTLRTVLDARAYMLRLSKDRERSARWQRAAQLRRPMSALSAGNSNSRCSMTAMRTRARHSRRLKADRSVHAN